MDCGNFDLCFRIFGILMGVHTGWMQESNFQSCLCPGAPVHNLTYECTTIGQGTTLWRGTAFNCSASGNEIALRHNRFKNPDVDGASNQCNNGNITGRILRVEREHYTSQIHVIVTPDLLGRTVECVHNDFSSHELIGNSTIVITTDPLPPLDDNITLSEIRLASTPELRFNWTENTMNSCHISYNITSDCGDCSTAANTAICVNVSVNNHTCSFALRTEVCGSIDTNNISVTLKVPDAPRIDAVPLYSHETGQLVGIKTVFMELAPFTITDGIDGGATSYTITYTEASSGNICDSKTIPSSSCSGGSCIHLLDLSNSTCGSAPISVKALATNVFGPGPVSSPITIFDTINNLFNVTFDLSSDVAICTFLNQHESTTKTCTLMITYNQSESCPLDTPDTSYTAQSASDVVRVSFPFVDSLQDGTEQHCFFVSASNGTYKAIIQGTLNTTGCDPNHLYAGAVVSSSAVAVCDPPLSYIGTSDGYACYSGTLVGAYAIHHCLNCDYHSVRVCMADGNWNGMTLQCKCSLEEPFQNQLSLSIVIPIVVLAILLSLAFIIVTITVIIKKQRFQRKMIKILQIQVLDSPNPEISTIYEEIANDSKPEQVMEENMAYNTVQEFREREKSEATPWPDSQLESKPKQIMEENMAYNTMQKFQEREKSKATPWPDSQLESKPKQIMEENMAYNTMQKFREREISEAIPWPDSQLESKPKQIMEENMAYNTMKEFQEREESPDSQLESKPEQIMEENMAYNTVKSESLPGSIDASQNDTDSQK